MWPSALEITTHSGYHKVSKCLLAASPPFSEAMTPSPRAGTIQSCHAQQEGLSTASSSSSSSFLLIHGQKSRRNLVSTILHLLRPRGPTGNLQLPKLLIFSLQTQPNSQQGNPSPSAKTQSKRAMTYWKMENKQAEGTDQISPINLGSFCPCWNGSRRISIGAWMCACIHGWDETEPLGSEPSPAVLFLN